MGGLMADADREEQEAAWSAEWLDGERHYEKLIHTMSLANPGADFIDMWEISEGMFVSYKTPCNVPDNLVQ
jgi:hypothetical protein